MQARKSTCRVICWGFPIDLSSFAMHFLFYSYSSLRINRSPPSSPFLSSKGAFKFQVHAREKRKSHKHKHSLLPPLGISKESSFVTLDAHLILFNLSLDEPLDERNSTEEGGRGVPLPLRSPPSEKSSKVQHLDRSLSHSSVHPRRFERIVKGKKREKKGEEGGRRERKGATKGRRVATRGED